MHVIWTYDRVTNNKQVQFGEFELTEEPQSVILGSCVTIGIYSLTHKVAGLPHITRPSNRHKKGFDTAYEILSHYEAILPKMGYSKCFIIGGSRGIGGEKVIQDCYNQLDAFGYQIVDLGLEKKIDQEQVIQPKRYNKECFMLDTNLDYYKVAYIDPKRPLIKIQIQRRLCEYLNCIN